MENRSIWVGERNLKLEGFLTLPDHCSGLVVFAHGSGSSRLSPRNKKTARALEQRGLGTLLFDLLTQEESEDRANTFDIPLLAERIVMATRWLQAREDCAFLPFGLFGASTGGGAALWAAADLGRAISAVVSRGGRPDLAGTRLLEVTAPTLLLVGGNDPVVAALNRLAQRALPEATMQVIPGASHLFEEPGTMEQVEIAAASWFSKQFNAREIARVA